MAFSIDDRWDFATAVVRAGNAAFGVYCRAGAWSAGHSEDGFVPAEIALDMGSPELASKLVGVGLWEAVDGGYLAVHFLERNESAEKKRARLKKEADRKARWRAEQAELSTRDKTGDRRRTSRRTSGRSPEVPLPPPKGGMGARERDAPATHPYEDDGGSCARCGLLRVNKIHPAA